MKKILHFIFVALCVVFMTHYQVPNVYALKKRIRAPKPVISYSSARLNHNTHSIDITFANLSRVVKVEYALDYMANGTEQGAMGSFAPSGTTDGRSLYFGTCSKGVCTPHYGITNASLTITATLQGGATYIKRYVIRQV